MDENFHFLARNCLEWKTDSPLIDSPRKSPMFSFLGIHWYFYLKQVDLNYNKSVDFQLHLDSVEKKALLNKDAKLAVFISKYTNNLACLRSVSVDLENKGTTMFRMLSIQASKDKIQDYYARWIIHCIFSTDLPSELLINGSEAGNLSNLLTLEGQCSTPDSIVMKAKLEASAPDDSPSGMENLSTDFSKLLEQKSSSDVTLTCGDRTFSAHKIILAARSDVFAAMFENRMIESETGSIDITDIDDEVFELLLKYTYTGKISNLPIDIASSLYMAADKYSIQSLKIECSKLMLGGLTKENCLDFLLLADACSDEKFKNKLINFIAQILNLIGGAMLKFTEKNPQLAISVYQSHALITKKV